LLHYEELLYYLADKLFNGEINEPGAGRLNSPSTKMNLSRIFKQHEQLSDINFLTKPFSLSDNPIKISDSVYLLPQYLFLFLKYQVNKPGLMNNIKNNPAVKNVRISIPDITKQYHIISKLNTIIKKIETEKALLYKFSVIYDAISKNSKTG